MILSSPFIYPNPADQYLYITLNDQASELVFVLYDVLGENLFSKRIDGSGEVAIPIGDLAEGIYYGKVSNSDAVHKIVIVH